MFSFKAYFWNNDVYINGQYKYAANEILTAYLNCNFIEAHEIIGNLRYLKKKMTVAQFEEWSRFASDLRNAAEKEKISFEDYYDKIRK